MAKSVASFAISVIARVDKFLRGFTKAQKKLRKFTNSVRVMAKRVAKLTAAISGLAIAAVLVFGRIALAGERFNQAMRRSQAIMSGLSESIRRRMTRTAIEVAKVTVFSAKQAAESYFFLASAGLDAAQSIKALPIVANFAQAGMFDMARATDLLTDAQSALGLSVKDAEQNMKNMIRVGDVLVGANKLANASVEQFSEALTNKAGAALKAAGKDIEEGVAVLLAFADQGIKASEAGTALSIILRDLQTKAIKNEKVFKRFGISVFNSSGKFRNLALVIASVEDALAGQSDKMRKAILLQAGFTDKSVSYLQTLLGTSRSMAAYETALRRMGGAMKDVADKQMTQWEKAVARMSAAWTAFSNSLQPLVSVAAIVMENISKKIGELSRVFTPEAIVSGIRTALNAIDLFVQRWWLRLNLFATGMLDTFRAILAFVGAREQVGVLDAVIDRMQEASAKQKDFLDLLKLVGTTTKERLSPFQINEMRKAGVDLEDLKLAGTRFAEFVEKPIREAAATFAKETMEAAVDAGHEIWSRIKFEFLRAAGKPFQEILKRMGFPTAPVRLKSKEGPGTGTFRQIDLSRVNLGLGLTRKDGQIVHDPANKEILEAIINQTAVIRGKGPAVAVTV